MSIIEYARLVKTVLDLQQEYFKFRKQSDLIRSKNLERELRAKTNKILKEADATQQPAAEQLTLTPPA